MLFYNRKMMMRSSLFGAFVSKSRRQYVFNKMFAHLPLVPTLAPTLAMNTYPILCHFPTTINIDKRMITVDNPHLFDVKNVKDIYAFELNFDNFEKCDENKIDAIMRWISKMVNLKELTLCNCYGLTDEMIAHLATTKLVTLRFTHSFGLGKFTGSTLELLSCLRNLDFGHEKLKCFNTDNLKKLVNLEKLRIGTNDLSFVECLVNLKELDLNLCRGKFVYVDKFDKLEKLELWGGRFVIDALKMNLKRLMLMSCWFKKGEISKCAQLDELFIFDYRGEDADLVVTCEMVCGIKEEVKEIVVKRGLFAQDGKWIWSVGGS